MNPERYTLILTSNLDENNPQSVQLAGGDDIKQATTRAEAILLAIAGYDEYEWVDDAIYAIDRYTKRATYTVAIRDNETGELADPEF